MKYWNRLVEFEVEAMQWADDGGDDYDGMANLAQRIVKWVNDNGGKAQYYPDGGDEARPDGGPRIGVRTISGWAYAQPGHYIVMGSAWLRETRRFSFDTCDPETFEQRWVMD